MCASDLIFVVEQECAYQDVDNKDLDAYHVWFENEDGIQAYVRVLDKGVSYEEVSIGRVLTRQRGTGLGERIMREGIRVAEEQYHTTCIRIEAQSYAMGFYEKLGFYQVSEPFLEDGILHIEMLHD